MRLTTVTHVRLPRRIVPTLGLAGIVGALLSVTACGGGPAASPTAPSGQVAASTTPSQPTLSQADVTRITTPVTAALGSGFAAFGSTLPGARPPAGTINMPVSALVPCPSGGSLGITGSLDGTISDSGSGQITINEQVTFTSCLSNGILLEGNPNITLSGEANFVDFLPVNPFIVHLTNGITFTYHGARGSLNYDCTGNIDVNTDHSTFDGSITVEFPIGTTATAAPCAGL